MRTAIFTICSKKFRRGLDVAIRSLRETNDLTGIDIVVMSPDIDYMHDVNLVRPDLDMLGSDPWPGGDMDSVDDWLDGVCREGGYQNWVEAYHSLVGAPEIFPGTLDALRRLGANV